ncbi:MAG TPA: hypothetical protein VN157_08910 [Caulobacter sp.]|nr:hypothetical protein [Caulobacter sp.]
MSRLFRFIVVRAIDLDDQSPVQTYEFWEVAQQRRLSSEMKAVSA